MADAALRGLLHLRLHQRGHLRLRPHLLRRRPKASTQHLFKLLIIATLQRNPLKVLLILIQRAHATLHGARQRQRAHPHALPHHPGINALFSADVKLI